MPDLWTNDRGGHSASLGRDLPKSLQDPAFVFGQSHGASMAGWGRPGAEGFTGMLDSNWAKVSGSKSLVVVAACHKPNAA